MANRVNFHHLYYFHVIAQEGAIAKAARRLRLGQPTLSTQLKTFEDQLGFTLFDRERKKLALTEQGRLVFDYANEIFRLGDEMVDALHDRTKKESIRLQIGAFDSVPKQVLNALVEQANRIAPCFVVLEEGPADSLLEALVSHRLDVVVTNNPAPIAPRSVCRSKLLGQVPMVVSGAKSFASLKRGFPRTLEGQPLILPGSGSRVREDVERYFEAQGVRPHIIGEAQDPEVQRLLAMGGTALAVLNRASVAASEAAGELVRIGELADVSEQIWLSCGIRRRGHPVVDVLMKEFKLPAL